MLNFEDLHIGDRVRLNDNSVIGGEYATICNLRQHDKMVCLRTDFFHLGQHDCDGMCEEGHGWNTRVHCIDVVFNENNITDSDLIEVLAI